MNLFTPAEVTRDFAKAGQEKAEKTFGKLFAQAVLAGLFIALGAAVTSTAAHSVENVSASRVISGLLFPFGLGMVILMGAELFTGNTMIAISVLNRDTTLAKMLRNWGIVYGGNFMGAIVLAVACAWFGQMNTSNAGLAVYAVKLAVGKCALPFQNAFIMGILCNILVCTGVLCSLSAKDTSGRILGAYIPVAFFVICGFEHCVANMFYIPAALFAMQVPEYAHAVVSAGIDTSGLAWGSFFANNLLPVTLGNIVGGVSLGALMWFCNLKPNPSSSATAVAAGSASERDKNTHDFSSGAGG